MSLACAIEKIHGLVSLAKFRHVRSLDLSVAAPIECTQGERVDLRVTVTQRETGAVAEGYAIFNCAGAIEQWEVHAVTHGKANFEEGPATAVAVATATSRRETTDAHQWLVNITLVGD